MTGKEEKEMIKEISLYSRKNQGNHGKVILPKNKNPINTK